MAKKKPKKDQPEEPSIEQAMEELKEIVTRLESGSETLDESLSQFERGMTLLRTCNRQLEGAEKRIDLVTRLSEDGTVETEPFDATATAETKGRAKQSRGRSGNSDEGGGLF